MFLGRVVGRLWATRQAAGLTGRKMLLVRPETADGREADRLVVAVDGLAAGPGDRVVVAHGSRVRDLTVGADVADKDIVIGIVDGHELKGAMILGRVDRARLGGAARRAPAAREVAGHPAARDLRAGLRDATPGRDRRRRRGRGRRRDRLPGRAGACVRGRQRHAGRRGGAGRRRQPRLGADAMQAPGAAPGIKRALDAVGELAGK